MDLEQTHFAAPLVIEQEDGTLVEFARVTLNGWARWKSRLAASNRRAILAAMLKDRERAPDAAIYKLANEELTKRRTLGEVVAYVSSEPAHIRRLLIEQAVAGGSTEQAARDAVDRIPVFDQVELADLLASEAVMAIPLLIPLARHRAKLAAQAMKREAMMRIVGAASVSVTPSAQTSSGNDSGYALAS